MKAPSPSPGSAALGAQESSAKVLRRLWERMISLYGHLWVSVHGLTPHEPGSSRLTISGDTWGRVLSGLSSSQIADGLARCCAGGSEYAPSAPRFRAMCYAIPSLASLRRELRAVAAGVEQRIPSSFTRAVWAELDVFRYRQASADQADRLLREAYELVVELTMRGVPLPEQTVALIEQEVHRAIPATPAQLAKHIADIHELLHGHRREHDAAGA